MTDLLQRGAAWLTGQLQAHASRPVTYLRGAQSVVVQATLGKSEFEQTDAQGFKTISEVRDWLIPTADLVLGGTTVLPERGDQIQESADDGTHLYEVVPVGGEPPYRYSDPYRRLLRIHVREIDRETL
jgi:hypothetical protein